MKDSGSRARGAPHLREQTLVEIAAVGEFGQAVMSGEVFEFFVQGDEGA